MRSCILLSAVQASFVSINSKRVALIITKVRLAAFLVFQPKCLELRDDTFQYMRLIVFL